MHKINFIKQNYYSFKKNNKTNIFSINKVIFLSYLYDAIKLKVQILSNLKNNFTFKHSTKLNLYINIYGNTVRKYIKSLKKLQFRTFYILNSILLNISNLLSSSNIYHNITIKTFGIINYGFTSHYSIGEKLGMMDFKNAHKIAGPRFVILKKDLVRLERALTVLMIGIHVDRFGYVEVYPPSLILENMMYKTGQLPKFYYSSFKVLHHRLIPTSEVSVLSIYTNTLLLEHDLPKRYVCYSQCYRSESNNKDIQGMLRQKQFSKVELVTISEPRKSFYELDRTTHAAETILQILGLPYRVVNLSSTELGFCAEITYDIEVWLPYTKKYREISSCSYCGAFQAQRMNTKYRDFRNKRTALLHTLNGSGLALGRTMVAILENFQNNDGSISIPHTLQPLMNYCKFIAKIT